MCWISFYSDSDFLQPPKSESDVEQVYEVSKTPEVKRWESFGSCLEIDAECVKVTREKVLASVQRKQKSFFHIFVSPHAAIAFLIFTRSASLAQIQVLESAQEVWGPGQFFRPRHCRHQEGPHHMRFLPRQQVQRQADSKRPRDSGGCQHADGQQSDTQVRLQTEHQKQNLVHRKTRVFIFCKDLPACSNISFHAARSHIVGVKWAFFSPDDASAVLHGADYMVL